MNRFVFICISSPIDTYLRTCMYTIIVIGRNYNEHHLKEFIINNKIKMVSQFLWPISKRRSAYYGCTQGLINCQGKHNWHGNVTLQKHLIIFTYK